MDGSQITGNTILVMVFLNLALNLMVKEWRKIDMNIIYSAKNLIKPAGKTQTVYNDEGTFTGVDQGINDLKDYIG